MDEKEILQKILSIHETIKSLNNKCLLFSHEKNIDKIIVLQRFARKNFKYFVFRRWIKSKEFNEWFYHPDNIGGKNAKRRLQLFLENVK